MRAELQAWKHGRQKRKEVHGAGTPGSHTKQRPEPSRQPLRSVDGMGASLATPTPVKRRESLNAVSPLMEMHATPRARAEVSAVRSLTFEKVSAQREEQLQAELSRWEDGSHAPKAPPTSPSTPYVGRLRASSGRLRDPTAGPAFFRMLPAVLSAVVAEDAELASRCGALSPQTSHAPRHLASPASPASPSPGAHVTPPQQIQEANCITSPAPPVSPVRLLTTPVQQLLLRLDQSEAEEAGEIGRIDHELEQSEGELGPEADAAPALRASPAVPVALASPATSAAPAPPAASVSPHALPALTRIDAAARSDEEANEDILEEADEDANEKASEEVDEEASDEVDKETEEAACREAAEEEAAVANEVFEAHIGSDDGPSPWPANDGDEIYNDEPAGEWDIDGDDRDTESTRSDSDDELSDFYRSVRQHRPYWSEKPELNEEDLLSRAPDMEAFIFFEMRSRVDSQFPEIQWEQMEAIREYGLLSYPPDWPRWRIDSFEQQAAMRAARSAAHRPGGQSWPGSPSEMTSPGLSDQHLSELDLGGDPWSPAGDSLARSAASGRGVALSPLNIASPTGNGASECAAASPGCG